VKKTEREKKKKSDGEGIVYIVTNQMAASFKDVINASILLCKNLSCY
jgi:hypothetical protein